MDISVESLYFSDLSFSDIRDLQSYNPIYSCGFLSLNKGTDDNKQRIGLNHIGLNQKYEIHSLEDVVDKQSREIIEKPIFIKYSPLLDPLQYLLGKYDGYEDQIRTLPTIDSPPSENTFTKLTNYNNSSYVDFFFYYLTGQLLHHSGFIHGIEYYGSYLGIQDNFKINVVDDIEYLQSHPVFLERINKTYFIDPDNCNSHCLLAREGGGNSRGNKHKLKISSSLSNISIHSMVDDLSNVPNTESQIIENNQQENTIETVYERDNHSKKSSSTNTSNNSEVNYTTDGEDENHTEEDEEDDEDEQEEEDDEDEQEEEDDEDEQEEEDDLFLYIKNFPCQLICIEKCDGTLDELFTKELVDKELGTSCMFQIIMTLVMYQNKFKFTHNDLHTNNIMYKNTDITHLIYYYRNKIYKVPTYGKIFKIIDFGRSIYEVNGQTLCSDSFQKHGDGHSQYNFEPFYDPLKPKILPNMSFDLCRLGCSIYDFIIDEEDDFEELDLFQKLIYTWCLDDNGKNVLYKRSGEERYPNFKLYKMIARTVHRHIPESQLDNPLFRDFCFSPTSGKKKNKKGDNKKNKTGEKIYEIHIE